MFRYDENILFTLEPPETGISEKCICDILGNTVLDINLHGLKKQMISLENQPKGMYFIRFINQNHSETTKILKQ